MLSNSVTPASYGRRSPIFGPRGAAKVPPPHFNSRPLPIPRKPAPAALRWAKIRLKIQYLSTLGSESLALTYLFNYALH